MIRTSGKRFSEVITPKREVRCTRCFKAKRSSAPRATTASAAEPVRSLFLNGRGLTVAAMDDSVQVKCTRCKSAYRDRARRLQNGYSRQCPTCEVVVFFDEDSPDPNIKSAMRTARRLRKELREAEAEFRPRMMSRRGAAHRSTDDENVA